ncbi:hypothetical protein M3Y94_00067500 [Aphelenchoides besseyi]|nr:hypothetical protein M3Y94_00067500 [Aphelenchoides besseyi]
MLGILGFPQSAVTNFGVVKRVFDPYLNDPEVPSGVLGLSWNPADKDNLTASAAPILHLFSQFGSSDRFFVQWLQDVTDAAEGREYSMWTQFGANLDGMCEEDYITAPLTYDESMFMMEAMRNLIPGFQRFFCRTTRSKIFTRLSTRVTTMILVSTRLNAISLCFSMTLFSSFQNKNLLFRRLLTLSTCYLEMECVPSLLITPIISRLPMFWAHLFIGNTV